MTYDQLRYFLEIALTNSFTKAAENLFITQAGLTYQIKQLENELGFKLFERSSHGVALTEQGHLLRPAIEHMTQTWEAGLRSATASVQESKAVLRVGLIDYLDDNAIFSVHEAFRALHPASVIIPHYMQLARHQDYINGLISSKADLIFIYDDEIGSATSLAFAPLGQLHHGVLVRRDDPLAVRQEAITFEDLAGRDIVLPDSLLLNENKRRFEAFAKRITMVSPAPRPFYVAGEKALRFMVSDIGAAGVVPYVSPEPLPSDLLTLIPIEDGGAPVHMGLAYRQEDQNPLVSDYVQLCQNLIAHG